MQITTNRDDWTGREITVDVDPETLSWRQDGYAFRLEARDVEGYTGAFYVRGDGWAHALFSVFLAGDGRWFSYGAVVERDADHPVTCAVRVLCNTL